MFLPKNNRQEKAAMIAPNIHSPYKYLISKNKPCDIEHTYKRTVSMLTRAPFSKEANTKKTKQAVVE